MNNDFEVTEAGKINELLLQLEEARAEIERLHSRYIIEASIEKGRAEGYKEIEGVKSDLHEMDKENDRLLDENSNMKQCCTRRGARMQLMRGWMEAPEVFDMDLVQSWFDKDGVPK